MHGAESNGQSRSNSILTSLLEDNDRKEERDRIHNNEDRRKTMDEHRDFYNFNIVG